MLQNMSIGRRLGLAFGVLLTLIMVVAGSGYWGTRAISALSLKILKVESPLADHAQAVQANALGLRRFEKDVFLNMADADKVRDYSTKWNDQRTQLLARLDTLSELDSNDAGDSAIQSMRRQMAAYTEGFNHVVEPFRVRGHLTTHRLNGAVAGIVRIELGQRVEPRQQLRALIVPLRGVIAHLVGVGHVQEHVLLKAPQPEGVGLHRLGVVGQGRLDLQDLERQSADRACAPVAGSRDHHDQGQEHSERQSEASADRHVLQHGPLVFL